MLASAVQGAIGFAFTLLAVSFFLLILQSAEAVQVMLVLNLAICGSLCRRLWRDVPLGLWRLLLAGAVVGVPLGVAAFAYASLPGLTLAIATAVLFSTALLALQEAPDDGSGPWAADSSLPAKTSLSFRPPSALAAALAAGAMTSALGMPGPVLVLYLTAIGADKATLRAVALTLFTALYIGAILVQSVTIGIPGRVWIMAATLLPLAWAGAAVGHRGAGHINEVWFRRIVLLLLAAMGSYMLITTLMG